MIPQKLQKKKKKIESSKCWGMIHLIINHFWYKKLKDQLQIFMASSNNFDQDSYFFIIWHLSSPMCARLKEFNISPLQLSRSTCTPSQDPFPITSAGLSPARWFLDTPFHQKKSMISTAWTLCIPRPCIKDCYAHTWQTNKYTFVSYIPSLLCSIWMNVWHTKQSSIQNKKYQMSHKCSCFSWWLAHNCPKHIQKRNKHTNKNCAPSWLYLQEYPLHVLNKYLFIINEVTFVYRYIYHNARFKECEVLSKTHDSCTVCKMINQKAWSHVGECLSINVSDYSQQMYHSL